MMATTKTYLKTDFIYRIQSVDFSTCLEVYDLESLEVVLRLSSDSRLQRWIFVGSNTNGPFKITNAATRNRQDPVHLALTHEDGKPELLCGIHPVKFEVMGVKGGDYIIYCSGPRRQPIYLTTSKDGKPVLREGVNALSKPNNPPRAFRWRIIEVAPLLCKGTYQIRSFGSDSALQIASGASTVSVGSIEAKAKTQEWQLIPIANGQCYIKHIAEEVFLGAEKNENVGDVEVRKAQEPFEWRVKEVGETTYSISVKWQGNVSTVKLLLVRGDKNLVLLKPNRLAQSPSRLWLFESSKGSPSKPLVPSETGPTTRLSEFPVNTKIGFRHYTCQMEVLPQVGTAPASIGAWIFQNSLVNLPVLHLTYLDETGVFSLSYQHSAYGPLPWCFARGEAGRVIPSPSAGEHKEWFLEREGEFNGVTTTKYYIHSAANPNMVIGIESIPPAGTSTVVNPLKVVPKVKNSNLQLWSVVV